MQDVLNALANWVPWPLPVRPGLDGLADPETRLAVAGASIRIGLAILLLTVGAVARRGRVVAGLVALTLVVTQVPALELLLVKAYPTSYRPSPTGFSAVSIAAGRAVFAEACVPCHGQAGDGVGGKGEVADLRRRHIWNHPVGDLFWFVSHGVDGEDGAPAMPAFGKTLSEAQRWSAIDYVYALNAGAVSHGLAGWPHRVPAPPVPLSCPGTAARALRDLRGKAVRVILGDAIAPIPAVPPVNGIATVTVWVPWNLAGALAGDTAARAAVPGIDCIAEGAAAPAAFAILAGRADGGLTQARFLIDPEGVLRSVWRPGDSDDPVRLLEDVRTICTSPLTIEPGDTYEHRH